MTIIEPTNKYSYVNIPVETKKIANKQLSTILQFVLPLLNFYRPLAHCVALTSGSLKILEKGVVLNKVLRSAPNLVEAQPNYLEQEESKETKENPSKLQASVELCAAVALVAATVFNHRLAMIATTSQEVLKDTYTIGQALLNKKYEDALKQSASLALHSIQLLSILTPSPQLTLISLIAQTTIEAYLSWHCFKKGKKLEGLCHLVLCSLYGYQVHQESVKLLINAKPFTTNPAKLIEEFFEYKKQFAEDHPVHFKDFLESKRYSTHLADMDFGSVFTKDDNGMDPSVLKGTMQGTIFENLTFTRCSFNSIDLTRAQISNCRFQWSSFVNTTLNDTKITNTTFDHCNFITATFFHSLLDNVLFYKGKFNWVFVKDSTWNHVRLSHCDLNYIYGKGATFNQPLWHDCQITNSDFIGSRFRYGFIVDSTLKEANFMRSQWQNMTVSQTDMTDTMWGYATLEDVNFKYSNLSYNNFYESHLNTIRMHQCRLEGAFFLDAEVKNSIIFNSDLTNCLFYKAQNDFILLNCTTPKITKPVIAISVDFKIRGVTVPELFQALKTCDGIPVKVDSMKKIVDSKKLTCEVNEDLEAIRQLDQDTIYSIPHQLLHQATPDSEVTKIKAYAKHIAGNADAMIVPGGADIEPRFYGAKIDSIWTDADEPYQRTVFEYALFDINLERNQPIDGICRGCQIGATFHGAKLIQHIDRQSGIQEYKVEGGVLQDLVGDELAGLSMHHQGVKLPVRNLIVTIQHSNIAKALEHPNKTCHLYQFHPEYSHTGSFISMVLSSNNKRILKHTVHLAEVYQQSKKS